MDGMQLYGKENCSDTGEPIVIAEGICSGPANVSVARAVRISAAAATCEAKSNPSDGKLMKLCAFSGSPGCGRRPRRDSYGKVERT
jgi:hypothetical protein